MSDYKTYTDFNQIEIGAVIINFGPTQVLHVHNNAIKHIRVFAPRITISPEAPVSIGYGDGDYWIKENKEG